MKQIKIKPAADNILLGLFNGNPTAFPKFDPPPPAIKASFPEPVAALRKSLLMDAPDLFCSVAYPKLIRAFPHIEARFREKTDRSALRLARLPEPVVIGAKPEPGIKGKPFYFYRKASEFPVNPKIIITKLEEDWEIRWGGGKIDRVGGITLPTGAIQIDWPEDCGIKNGNLMPDKDVTVFEIIAYPYGGPWEEICRLFEKCPVWQDLLAAADLEELYIDAGPAEKAACALASVALSSPLLKEEVP